MNRLVALLALCPALPLVAQQESTRQDVPFTWRERVAAGAWLRVYSTMGPIDVIAADGPEAEVQGERAPGSRWADLVPSYVVLRDGNDVVLCVLTEYQECTLDGLESERRRWSRRGERTPSVALTVKVPRGVRLGVASGNGGVNVSGATSEVEARSGNGDVSVDGAGDRVDASSGNGDIRVTTALGPVSATTGNGRVWVRMERLTEASSMDFRTGNGTITVTLPDNLAADIEATTGNGQVDSDFPITTQGRFSTHRLFGRIGGGGPRLELRTGNGDIELRKLAGGR